MKVDNSQLQSFINCPRLYYNKYVLQLQRRKVDEGIQTRSFGSEIHEALHKYFDNGQDEEAAYTYFKSNYVHMEGEKLRTTGNGVKLLQDFFPWWKANFSQARVLGSEVKAEFGVRYFTWIVKIDLIIELNSNIFVVDFKTTTKMTHTFFRQFTPNMQVSGYCEYARRTYGNCAGFIPVAMHMGYRQRAYKGEPAGFWCKFSYDIANRTREQLDDWAVNVLRWVTLLQNSEYPRNEQFCESFYGCQYRELCVACDDENIRSNLYEKVDAFAYLEEGGEQSG